MKHIEGGALFYDLPSVHHTDPVGDVAHQTWILGDAMKEALIESRFGWGIAEGFPGFFSQLSGLFFGFYSGLGRQFRSFLEGLFSLGTGRRGTGLGLGSELLEGIGTGCLESVCGWGVGGGFGGPAGFFCSALSQQLGCVRGFASGFPG